MRTLRRALRDRALVIGVAIVSLLILAAFLGWFAALVTGRMPLGLGNAGALVIGYAAQTYAYLLIVTGAYPYSGPAEPRPAPAFPRLPPPLPVPAPPPPVAV